MKPHSITEIAQWAQAEIRLDPSLHDPNQTMATGVSIDTRTMTADEIFMPIIGEKMDGHRFLATAFEKRAAAAFIDRDHLNLVENFKDKIFLLVDDTLEAFQTLAANYRKSLDVLVVGVTGSNGKTTTKDILASVLTRKFRTVKTIGNLNNEIGVPRTLLDLDETTEVAIIEMGMSDFGEIDTLVKMARPHIAIITNVGQSHLNQLGSQENIAKAKMEIVNGMGPDDLLIYNRDSSFLAHEVDRRKASAEGLLPRTLSFGQDSQADSSLSLTRSNEGGSSFTLGGEPFSVNLLGSYQMYNAAAAILCAKELDLDEATIQAGLQVTDQTKMRSELIHAQGFDILVDCYNSSPQSLREALHTTEVLAGYRKKIAILGDMLELGPMEKKIHFDIGQEIDPEVFSDVLFFGPLAKYMMEGASLRFRDNHLFWFSKKSDLVDRAKTLIEPASLVLVKASRALRLEEIVESIKQRTAQ